MSKARHPSCLDPSEEDVRLLVAANCHIGSKNCDKSMEPYVSKRRNDGIHIIDLQKTWEKIVLAARVIVTIENPKDVCVISARPYGQRAAHKFSQYTDANSIASRFTPGTFTNYITRAFKEPRLIITTDPKTDHQAIKEAAFVNIPVISLCDTDSSLTNIHIAIPTNNKAKHAIGLVYYLLAREVLRLRGSLRRTKPWEVMPDMFFFRDPEESLENEKESETKQSQAQQASNAEQNEDINISNVRDRVPSSFGPETVDSWNTGGAEDAGNLASEGGWSVAA